MISVFSGDFAEATIIRNLLEHSGIRVFLMNELMAGIEPVISPGGFNPVVLRVGDADFESAIAIINDYNSGNLTLPGSSLAVPTPKKPHGF